MASSKSFRAGIVAAGCLFVLLATAGAALAVRREPARAVPAAASARPIRRSFMRFPLLLDLDSVRSYVQALELNSGGFRAGLWDNRSDVEYTFYGLGVLGLLS